MEEAGWRRYAAQKADRERRGLGGAPSLDIGQIERLRESLENGECHHQISDSVVQYC